MMRKVCADFIWKAFWKWSQPNKILFLLKNDPSPDNPTRSPISQIDDEAGLEIMMIMIQHCYEMLMTMVKMMLLSQRGRRKRGGGWRIFCDLHDDNTAAGTVLSELDNVKTLPTNEILGCLYGIRRALGHKIARHLWRTGICCIDCDIMNCDVAMTMLTINVNNQNKSDDEGTWAVLRVIHCQHFVPKYWILGSWYEVADCGSRYCQR